MTLERFSSNSEQAREGPVSGFEQARTPLGAILTLLGALLGPSRGLLERSCDHLEASWSALEAVSKALGALLGLS